MTEERDRDIDVTVGPSGPGCAECLAGEGPGWWVQLVR